MSRWFTLIKSAICLHSPHILGCTSHSTADGTNYQLFFLKWNLSGLEHERVGQSANRCLCPLPGRCCSLAYITVSNPNACHWEPVTCGHLSYILIVLIFALQYWAKEKLKVINLFFFLEVCFPVGVLNETLKATDPWAGSKITSDGLLQVLICFWVQSFHVSHRSYLQWHQESLDLCCSALSSLEGR